jgi:hypothetical protein
MPDFGHNPIELSIVKLKYLLAFYFDMMVMK